MFRQIEVALSPEAGVNLSRDGSPPPFSGPIILPLPPGRLPAASGGRSGPVGGHFPAICRENGVTRVSPTGKGEWVWIVGRRSGDGCGVLK